MMPRDRTRHSAGGLLITNLPLKKWPLVGVPGLSVGLMAHAAWARIFPATGGQIFRDIPGTPY